MVKFLAYLLALVFGLGAIALAGLGALLVYEQTAPPILGWGMLAAAVISAFVARDVWRRFVDPAD